MSRLIHLPETASTNQYLNDLQRKENLEEGCIVLADFQSAGKGQAGNHWESEKGQNLTFSLLLQPEVIEAHNQFIISQLVSLGIADTLAPILKNVCIKWPNDIYVGNKKIGGILIENIIHGRMIESSVIGIGLNVNQKNFSNWIPNPTSIKLLTNINTDCPTLLHQIHNNIFARYMEVLNGEEANVRESYFRLLFRKEGFFPFQAQGTVFVAKILSVEHSGHIVLESEDGSVQTFAFKEVEFILT